ASRPRRPSRPEESPHLPVRPGIRSLVAEAGRSVGRPGPSVSSLVGNRLMTKPHWIRGIAIALLCLGPAAGPSLVGDDAPKPDAKPRLADYFGFLPMELYKLDYRIGYLTLADVDGDGTDDVIVANNARSRIDLLLSSR